MSLRWAAMDPAVERVVALGAFAEFNPAMERMRREYAAWVPAFLVRGAARWLPTLLKVEPPALDTTAAVRGHALRAFLVAATEDAITPPEDSQQLRDALGCGSEFLVVGPATHENLPYQLDQHGPAIRAWLATPATSSPTSPPCPARP